MTRSNARSAITAKNSPPWPAPPSRPAWTPCAAIEVEATKPLPFVVKEDDAKEDSSPRVWEDAANLSRPRAREQGEVDKAFADSAAVVEGFFTTPVQIHHPLETHGNTVSWKDDGITCWASTQGITQRARRSGRQPEASRRTRCASSREFMGGGFGAKLGFGIEGGLAARLSKEAKAPVKLMLTRFDQSLAVGNRPSTFQKIKLGATADGQLTGVRIGELRHRRHRRRWRDGRRQRRRGKFPRLTFITFRTSATQTVLGRHQCRFRPRLPRAQPSAGVVRHGIHPGRTRGEAEHGSGRVAHQERPVERPRKIREKEFRLGAERFGWKEKYKKPGSSPGPIKTGVGCASAHLGRRRPRHASRSAGQPRRQRRNPLRHAGPRAPEPKRSSLSIAADLLGLKPEQIRVRIGDTQFPPSGGSGGSTTAASVSPAIYDTCTKALEELQQKSGVADARGENWMAACKKLGMDSHRRPGPVAAGTCPPAARRACSSPKWTVDTDTGFVKVKKITCVQDGGLIVSKLTAESQVNGGIIMGIGYALYEERVMDATPASCSTRISKPTNSPASPTCRKLTSCCSTCPSAASSASANRSRFPTAAAIANAVANAIGVRVSSLPITPQKVLAALGKDKSPAA